MPTITIELPKPHQGQQHVLRNKRRFNVVACGRRWGKTDMGVGLAMKPALDGHPVGWFAPTYKLLEEAWVRFDDIIPRAAVKSMNKAERTIELVTGGRIDFWTLKPLSKDHSVAGRGRKYKRSIVDEAAMAPNLEHDWTQAIRPTLTDLIGDSWFLSTPHGQDYFYRLFRKAESKPDIWAAFQMPTSANPFIDAQEIDDARAELPADAFAQEYLAEFLANAANPFGIDAIRECIAPMSHRSPVVWGVDLARSHDWTVAVALDGDGVVCDIQRWQGPWNEQIDRLGLLIGDTPALVDSTGVGCPIVEALQLKLSDVEGFKFSSTSKQQLMEGLAVAIHKREVRYPDCWLVQELESFQYEYTRTGVRYSAPDGLHDDGVCALSLAVRHRSTAALNRFTWRVI